MARERLRRSPRHWRSASAAVMLDSTAVARIPRRAAAVREDVTVSVVVPVYNEAEVLETTYERLTRVLDAIGEPYEILFVDDGSDDGSDRILRAFHGRSRRVGVLGFSRNFGHQIAITAGMEHARGQAVVVIDADLQDPPELIPELLARWRRGYDVVYARRLERRGEGPLKRWTAAVFYRLLRRLTDVPIPTDVGDFRLIDRRVRDVLLEMPERHRYVRGLVAWAGFRQTAVDFTREARLAGTTKYSLRKMCALAADGILSFSDLPLRLASLLGVLLEALSTGALAVCLAAAVLGRPLTPWLLPLALFGVISGVTLLAVGVVGAYVMRVYDEVRGRPLYVVSDLLRPGRRDGGGR